MKDGMMRLDEIWRCTDLIPPFVLSGESFWTLTINALLPGSRLRETQGPPKVQMQERLTSQIAFATSTRMAKNT